MDYFERAPGSIAISHASLTELDRSAGAQAAPESRAVVRHRKSRTFSAQSEHTYVHDINSVQTYNTFSRTYPGRALERILTTVYLPTFTRHHPKHFADLSCTKSPLLAPLQTSIIPPIANLFPSPSLVAISTTPSFSSQTSPPYTNCQESRQSNVSVTLLRFCCRDPAVPLN